MRNIMRRIRKCNRWLIVFFLGVLLTATKAYSNQFDPFALDDLNAPRKPAFHLSLQFSGFAYNQSHQHSDIVTVEESRLQFDFSIPIKDHTLYTDVEGGIRHPLLDHRKELTLRELYLDWRPTLGNSLSSLFTDLFVRSGVQIFSWGSGLLHNPTDNISPWNVVDPFQPYQRGIPAVKLSLASGLQMIEVIYLATFVPTELPGLGERFFLYSPQAIPNPRYPSVEPKTLKINYIKTDNSFAPKGTLSSNQFALRYCVNNKGWDIALSYFKGYENIAVFEGVPVGSNADGGMDMIVNYLYPREQVLGLDLSGYIGKVGLHLEGAYFDMQSIGRDVGVGDEDYFSMIAGIEYPFNDVIDTQDFNLVLEYAGEIPNRQDERIYINRIYREAVFLRLAHIVNYKVSGEFRFVNDFKIRANYLSILYCYQYTDYTKISLGLDIFQGPTDTFFGQYDQNDRLFIIYKLSF